MRFLSKSELRERFEGKTVAIVGSGPGCLTNERGLVDSHDVVVRVNNYVLSRGAGLRTDVFYSFFGTSIRKSPGDLARHGVRLCMCKCPNAHAIESDWHRRQGKLTGVDFRWIYERRRNWWFCDTYVPPLEDFLASFELLGRHVPTTGFSAILEILSHDPRAMFLTGFDFFRSGIHDGHKPWRPKNLDDPIRHEPEREAAWLVENVGRFPITTDEPLARALAAAPGVAA